MIDVGRWLDEIGLPQYAAVFAAEAIDAGVLPTLTDVELRDLGLPLGHRKRLLAAIAALATAAACRARSGDWFRTAAHRRAAASDGDVLRPH